MSIPVRRKANPLFGRPTLFAVNNGSVEWVRGETSPLDQKGSTGWLAKLTGGVQTGDDWARINFPVDEIFVTDFHQAEWSWHQTNTETMGLGIVIWVHDPNDFDNRAEITQLGGHADLPKAAGWNAFSFSSATGGMFFYGEGTTGTELTAGTQYTWSQFQADALFKNWTIYRITFDSGWEASGTFQAFYVADVKLNGVAVPLFPFELDTLPPNSNVIGKLGANSGVDIGDVDVLSIAAGTNLLGKVGIDQATANANEVVVKSITAGDTNIGNVDLASAIPAGTNLMGKVGIDQATANANEVVVKSITAGDNNIGNVDVATEPSGPGTYTTPAHTQPSIAAATTEALAANANRLYALLINDSDEVIYIKLGADAVANQGIRLNASGGSYEMSKKLGNLYVGAINGICASGSKILLVLEGD